MVRQPGQCLDHDRDALAPLEPADVPETELPVGGAVRCRREATEVDAEPHHAHDAAEPLAPEDLPGFGIAAVDAGRRPQRPPLDPPERRWIALLDVLCPVEEDRRLRTGEGTDDEHLERGEARRLLVAIDDVGSQLPKRAPDRPRVVHEAIGMTADGSRGARRSRRSRRQRRRRPRPRSTDERR